MKLEKREITLNEYDSLMDAFYLHKTLINEYLSVLFSVEKKQIREGLLQCIKETAEDGFFLLDLIHGSAMHNKKN